jgi:hypothetical protein
VRKEFVAVLALGICSGLASTMATVGLPSYNVVPTFCYETVARSITNVMTSVY